MLWIYRPDLNQVIIGDAEKFFKQALKDGPTDGWKLDQAEFETAKAEYYRQSGWDVTSGLPTPQTLERLGLEWT